MVHTALLMLAVAVPAADADSAGLSNFEIAQHAEAEFRLGVEQRGDRDRAVPHFRNAADSFDELRRRGADNPELYRNLGNASLLADDLPRAVLSYRRGLRLAPTDADLLAGLDEARSAWSIPRTAASAGHPTTTARRGCRASARNGSSSPPPSAMSPRVSS